MTWEMVNKWHMKNGEWTITRPTTLELYTFPYGLHHGQTNHGYYKTVAAAIAAHTELTAGKPGKSATITDTSRGPKGD